MPIYFLGHPLSFCGICGNWMGTYEYSLGYKEPRLECLGMSWIHGIPSGVIKKGEETKNAPWKNLSHRTSSKLVDLSTILIWFPEAKHYFPEKKPLVTATGWKFWRGGWNIRWMESHMIHGAGIFTYITGSFFSGKCRKIFQHHGDWWNV